MTLRDLIAARDRAWDVYYGIVQQRDPLAEPMHEDERTAKHAVEAAESAVQAHPLVALLDELSSDWLTTTGLDLLITAVEAESALVADVARLEAALSAYANEANWATQHGDEGDRLDVWMPDEHGFLKAQAALGAVRDADA